MARIRRIGIAAAAVATAGLIGAGVISATSDHTPAPVVWTDVVGTSPASSP
jgi:hypothetical protein